MFQAPGDACQGLRGTEERVFVGTVADPLAFDTVLLLDKFQGCRAQVGKLVVIQGCVGGVVHHAANVKVDVSEFEGLACSVGGAGVATFGRSKQPVEDHDDEVNDVSIESSLDGALNADDIGERADDGHIDQAGAGQRVVVFAQLGEEISV